MKFSSALAWLLARTSRPQSNYFRRARRHATLLHLETLEDRLAPAITTFIDGILTVNLNNANEAATLTNAGGNITLTSNNAITGDGFSFMTTNVTKIVVIDPGDNAGQSITFAGSTAYSLSGGLDSTGVETNTFDQAVTATEASSLSVTAPRNIAVNANLTGGSGGLTLSANQQTTATGGNFIGIEVTGATVTTTGGGNVLLQGRGGNSGSSNYGVRVQSAGEVSGSGAVTVEGTGGTSTGVANHGVLVTGLNSRITSSGGAVLVKGTGGGDGASDVNIGVVANTGGVITSAGTGSGAIVTVEGQGGNTTGTGIGNHGVYVADLNSRITSSGGAVLVKGTGGGAGNSSSNIGVLIHSSGAITSAGTGSGATVTVEGQGGNMAGTGANNHGVYVYVSNAQITSSGGAVSVTGVGASNSQAIWLEANGRITSGNNAAITVTADSVNLLAGSGGINSGSGTTTIRPRTAGTQINLGGADVLSGSPLTLGLTSAELNQITAGKLIIGRNDLATGTVTVSSAVAPANAPALDVITARNIVVNANLTGGSGGLSLSANRQAVATNDNFTGVTVSSAAVVTTTGNGPVLIEATGGSGEGGSNRGVLVSGQVTAGGTGAVTVVGVGGSGSGLANYGVRVGGSTASITSGGGNVSVSGTGGSGNGGQHDGVSIGLGQITSGGSGNVTVNGTGGSGSGNINPGVFMSGGMISSGGSGTVTVVGTGGSGVGLANFGINLMNSSGTPATITSGGGTVHVTATGTANSAAALLNNSTIGSGSNAALTVTADSISLLGTSTLNSGSGRTTIQTRTPGTLINLGGADVLSGSPLTLGLTAAELNAITAGTLQIGTADSGAITVSNDVAPANTTTLRLTTPSTITATAGGIVVANLALDAGGVIHFTDSTTNVTTLAVRTSNDDFTFAEADTVTYGTVDGLTGIDLGTARYRAHGGTQVLAATVNVGTIEINAGTLKLGASDVIVDTAAMTPNYSVFDLAGFNETLGQYRGTGQVVNSTGTPSTLTLGANDATSGLIVGVVSDAINLRKIGTGLLELNAANTYIGTTTIDGGTLLINGSTVDGPAAIDVLVNNGGTLGGTGTVGGVVNVNPGGTLSPGASIGTLTVNGNVNFSAGSTFFAEIGPDAAADQLVVTGVVSIANGTTLLGTAATPLVGNYTLIDADSLSLGTTAFKDVNGTNLPPPLGGPIVLGGENFFYRYDLTTNDFLLTPQILADLSITKTDGVTTAIPGTSVTYTIVVSNAGPGDVTGVSITDTFPAAITSAHWTSLAAGGATGNTAVGSGNLNETVNLPAGSSITYTVTANISPAATGTLSNTATLTAPDNVMDLDPENNSATDTNTLTPQADLSITKTDGVTTAIPGGSVTYTIVVSNTGPSDAPGATVTDTFPAAITSASWTSLAARGASGNTAVGSGNLNETVNLPAGGSITYTVTANISPSATGTLSNTATVTAPGGVIDPDLNNNSATDTNTLTPQADLALMMVDAPDPVVAGTNLTYTLTLVNNGLSDAQNVVLTDTLPAGTTFVSFAAPGGFTTATPAVGAGGMVTASTATLAAGANATFTLVVRVSPSVLDGSTLSNTATVSSSTMDSTPSNNNATAVTAVLAQADLALTMVDAPDPVFAGNNLTYTITLVNNGPSDAQNVVLTNALPTNTTLMSFTPAVGFLRTDTVQAGGVGTVRAARGTLAAGASATFTLVVRVNPGATNNSTLSNTANVTTITTDPTPGNNSATATTSVLSRTDLAVSISAPSTANEGTSFNYNITVTNLGPSNAQNVLLTDVLPALLTFNSASASQGTVSNNNGTVSAVLGTLNAGGKASVTVVVTPRDNGTLSNTATVTTSTTELNSFNNSATAYTTVNNVAPQLVPLVGPITGVVGQPLTYSASWTDPGVLDTFTGQWDFGNATRGQVVTPPFLPVTSPTMATHTFTAPGTYTVRFTVRDKDGGASVATRYVTITAASSNMTLSALQAPLSEPTTGTSSTGGRGGSSTTASDTDIGLTSALVDLMLEELLRKPSRR